jgi:phosphoglycolate phosphatase
MLRVDSVVFDLDGTLWDTTAACARAWNVVVQRNGIAFRTITAEDVRKVTGKPHDACIRETFVGLSDAQLRLLSDETSIEDNVVIEREGGALYDGVSEGLRTLARSYPLFIVSNCQNGYIELFAKLTGLGATIRDFECWGRTGRTKAENLKSLIDRNQLANPCFVGDTTGDRDAARACGIPFVHVEYGYGACDDADLRVKAFPDLTTALCHAP